MPETAILLVWCADRKGLVARIAEFISAHGGNILDFDQHTDTQEGMFLARAEWELAEFTIPRAEIAARFEPLAAECGMEFEIHFGDKVPRLAIFVSKLQHCLEDLLIRRRAGEFAAEIAVIIGNHREGEAIANAFGVPFLHLPVTSTNKQGQDSAALQELRVRKVDLVVLARYMQVLSANFVSQFPNRIINIHHSFLPAFSGARPYHRAHERGVKLIGATGHYVTMDLDEGPIIDQETARISHRDSVDDLIRKGRDLEKSVVARSVRLHLAHRVLSYRNKTVVFE